MADNGIVDASAKICYCQMEYQYVSRSSNMKKRFEILLKKAKGHLISKGLVGVLIFPKNERKQVNLRYQ